MTSECYKLSAAADFPTLGAYCRFAFSHIALFRERLSRSLSAKDLREMCSITYFQQKRCQHIWATVSTPCGPGMGFATCSSFGDGISKESPGFYKTDSRACPRCDLLGHYDRNAMRMVERMGWGLKWGTGPDEDDWGVDVKFGGNMRTCAIL